MTYLNSQCKGFWCSIKKAFYGINNRTNLPENQQKKSPIDEQKEDQELQQQILIKKQRDLHSNIT